MQSAVQAMELGDVHLRVRQLENSENASISKENRGENVDIKDEQASDTHDKVTPPAILRARRALHVQGSATKSSSEHADNEPDEDTAIEDDDEDAAYRL